MLAWPSPDYYLLTDHTTREGALTAKKKESQNVKSDIRDAAVDVLREAGAQSLTVDKVAKRVGCAKSLVHYHFRTKDLLIAEAVRQLYASRKQRWSDALEGDSANSGIDRTWQLLCAESEDGTLRAAITLVSGGGKETDRSVREMRGDFAESLGSGAVRILDDLGVRITVPQHEVGWLLAAILDGIGADLTAGIPVEDLEGPYAAGWLGILSLSR